MWNLDAGQPHHKIGSSHTLIPLIYSRVPNQVDRVRDQVTHENDKFTTKCTVKTVNECFSVSVLTPITESSLWQFLKHLRHEDANNMTWE